MLTSLLGIRLIVLAGPTVPVPAPYEVVSVLTRVDVMNDTEPPGDGFTLTLNLSKQASGEYSILDSGIFDPFNRVVIGVILGVTPEVLIDGVVTRYDVTPTTDPGTSTLVVYGKDNTAMMDLEDK